MNIFTRIKLLLGWPPKPLPHQIGENWTTMRADRDCLPVATSNATRRSYEECYKACNHMDLPFFLESPIFANPFNAVRAINKLGFEADDTMTLRAMTEDMAGKIIILVHNPESEVRSFLDQHWVTWHGHDMMGLNKILWGSSQKFKLFTDESLRLLVESGWFDCIILVK